MPVQPFVNGATAFVLVTFYELLKVLFVLMHTLEGVNIMPSQQLGHQTGKVSRLDVKNPSGQGCYMYFSSTLVSCNQGWAGSE